MAQSSDYADYDSFDPFSRVCAACKVEMSQFGANGLPGAWLYSRTSGIITGKWLGAERVNGQLRAEVTSCIGTSELDIKPTGSRTGDLPVDLC